MLFALVGRLLKIEHFLCFFRAVTTGNRLEMSKEIGLTILCLFNVHVHGNILKMSTNYVIIMYLLVSGVEFLVSSSQLAMTSLLFIVVTWLAYKSGIFLGVRAKSDDCITSHCFFALLIATRRRSYNIKDSNSTSYLLDYAGGGWGL